MLRSSLNAVPLPGSRTLAAIMFLATIVSTVTADDGSMETVGGAVRLMKDQGSVRMVSETVRARVFTRSLDADHSIASVMWPGEVLVEVDCVFTMKNEGPADTVLVGFPDGSRARYSRDHEMESFRSWVDGVEVRCQRVPDANEEPEDIDAASWWTKRVAFPRGAVRTIRDHYTVSPSWYPMTGRQSFQYSLWTGASWKGTIGSAEIVTTLDGIPLEWVTGTDPEARKVDRSFRWSFRDFEPGSADGSPASVVLEWKLPGRAESAEEPDTLGR